MAAKGTLDDKQWAIIRLKNELGALYSDSRTGGPDHLEEIEALRVQIAALEKENAK